MNRPDPRYEYMTLDEFEEMLPDKPADEKWELIGGRVVRMMVGARWEHHRLASNLHVALANHLRTRGLPCSVFQETFYLKYRPDDLAVFPDIQVHCGTLMPGQTSIDDPVVLIEIVSRGSQYRDRIEKRGFYEKLPSVAHIVMVSLDDPEIEVLTRKEAGIWEARLLSGHATELHLSAIDFQTTLAEVYRGVFENGDRAVAG